MKYAILTSLWGDEYINFYFNHILPYTLKSINNDTIIVLNILTHELDKITSLINTDKIVVVSNNLPYCDKYSLASVLDKNGMRVAIKEKNITNFICQNPDVLISSSLFNKIYSSSKKVITVPSIRILKEEFLLIYKSLQAYNDDEILDYAISTPHPMTKALSRKGGYRLYDSSWPSMLYEIDSQNNRIFGAGFHWHPVYFEIKDESYISNNNRTLDDTFLSELSYDLDNDFDFLHHSSEGFVLEFSSLYSFNRILHHSLTNNDIISFMNQHCCDTHKKMGSLCYTWSKTPNDAIYNPFCGIFPMMGLNG